MQHGFLPTRNASLARAPRPAPGALALALTLTSLACGPAIVQMRGTEGLPDEQVAFMFSNPHLDLTVDREFTLLASDAKSLKRVTVPTGHHAVEASCIYSSDVPYHASKGDGPAPPASPEGAKLTKSLPVAVVLEGEAGHAYKPRAHFFRDDKGTPGCRVHMVDVTAEPAGKAQDLY